MPKKPSKEYSRMFSAFAGGTFFVVTGLIGWNVSKRHALLDGRWAEGPIWSQVMLGVVFLLLGVYWSRRLGDARWTLASPPQRRVIKNAGRGKSSGARLNPQKTEAAPKP